MDAIIANTNQIKDIKTLVFNVTPPTESSYFKSNDIRFKQTGSDTDRKIYTKYMNLCLMEKCYKFNFEFIDVYNNYCDQNGFLNRNLSDQNVHIKNPIFIEEFIKNKLL